MVLSGSGYNDYHKLDIDNMYDTRSKQVCQYLQIQKQGIKEHLKF